MELRNVKRKTCNKKESILATKALIKHRLTVHQLWQIEYDKAFAMVDKFSNIKTYQGKKWREGMVRHWESRVRELADNEPDKE